MLFTLDATLKRLERFISADIISPTAFGNISGTIAHLPAATTNYFGFESVLGSDNPQADFALFFENTGPGRYIIAGDDPDHLLPPAIVEAEEWQRIRALCRQWNTGGSPVNRAMNSIWLEYDVDGPPPTVPIPGIFIGLASGDRNYGWLSDEALPILFGRQLSAKMRHLLQNSLSALPEKAVLFQAGLMLSRKAEAVRICLTHSGFSFSESDLKSYLDTIGWPGDFEDLYQTIAYLENYVDKVIIDLDISDRVAPKVGLECYIRRKPVTNRWQRFLSSLAERGLCTPGKLDGCLQWAGKSLESLPHLNHQVGVYRQIHHVKLVYQPGKPLQAKAYLLCTHHIKKSVPESQRRQLETAGRD